MKIKLTRNTFVAGRSLSVGDEVDIPEAVGRRLLLMRKAVEVESQAVGQPEVQLPDVVPEAIEPLIETQLTTDALLTKAKRKKSK